MVKRSGIFRQIRFICLAAVLLLAAAATACTAAPTTAPSVVTSLPPTSTVAVATTLPPTTAAVTTIAVTTPPPPVISVIVTPTPSASPSPSLTPPTTTPAASPRPTTVYTPTAAPYMPQGDEAALFQYMLDIINQDRGKAGLDPVVLTYNAAAEEHAKDMLDNQYLAHWGTDGQKPYMRYTKSGGLNYEGENSALTSGNKTIDAKTEIAALENMMMTDDAASNWGHRDNILNPRHKKVSLGIAYSQTSVALVQQFEGDYVQFFQPPAIKSNILSLSGRFTQAGLVLNNTAVTYDPLPQPLTAAQLGDSKYHTYGLGKVVGQVFAPPPPGASYQGMPTNSIIAQKGSFDDDGAFYLEADISQLMQNGKGVYTIVLVAVYQNKPLNWTNYSIFVK